MANKKAVRKSKAKTAKKISENDIRKKAQEIYDNRIAKGIDGDEISDWVLAEKELVVKK
jgi:ribosomal protein S6E (S10)